MKKKVLLLVVALCYSAGLFAQSKDLRGQRAPAHENINGNTNDQKIDTYGSFESGVGEIMLTDCLTAFAYYLWGGGITQGPSVFDLYEPATIYPIAPGNIDEFISAGTWANGKWYGMEWGIGSLYEINHSNGIMKLIGTCYLNIGGMAWDGTTMYAASITSLYSIDLDDGSATYIGEMGNPWYIVGMACDSSGNLYGVDPDDDNLYSIDGATGAATVVGPLGIDLDPYAQDIEYDKDNDILYLAGWVNSVGGLYIINPSTGAATFVGEFMNGASLDGFAIPYGDQVVASDIAVISIPSPSTDTLLSSEELVVVELKNMGIDPQSNFEVSYKVNGDTPVTEVVTDTIYSCGIIEYTFMETVDLSDIAQYNIEVCAELDGDEIPANNCRTKHIFNFPTVIEENLLNNTRVYPNPASAFVDIECEELMNSIRITNITGQVLFIREINTDFYRLNTSDFVPGIYYLMITTDDKAISRRIVIY